MKISHKTGSSSIEYLIVVCLLFIISIPIIDIALFFKQSYLVQSFADTLLVDFQNAKTCTDISKAIDITKKRISKTFNTSEDIGLIDSNNKVLTFASGNFLILLACKNENTPSDIIAQYNYNGILWWYKNKKINSNPSVNLSVYY